MPVDNHYFNIELILAALVAAVFAMFMIAFGPRIVGVLIFKYLRFRKIAWVSLLAVMLCTTMVLVVISVMGGWLDMFESSAKGLTGDLIIRSGSLSGFSGYEAMIREIDQLPAVDDSVATIQTFGLLNIAGLKSTPVQVVGLPIDQIGRVNKFPDSLYRQRVQPLDRLDEIAAERKKLEADSALSEVDKAKARADLDLEAAEMKRRLAQPPTFNLHDPVDVQVALPGEVKLSDPDKGTIQTGDSQIDAKVHFRPSRDASGRTGYLVSSGPIDDPEADKLRGLSDEKSWVKAVTQLARESHWPGMIASTGVLEIRKDAEGKMIGREPFKHHLNATLTVLGVSRSGKIDPNNRADTSYWIIDDSHTKMWQYDMQSVYVPFDVLQSDLGMAPAQVTDRDTGKSYTDPDRTSEIHVKLKPGADLLKSRDQAQSIVDRIIGQVRAEAMSRGETDDLRDMSEVRVETWRQSEAKFIDAIQNEKVLVVLLFGIISVVAIFLIFCIFYMIVAEKMRDIGIIKSVGATSYGVAGIFLGYGLVIGVVGAGMGLLASYLIIHNINALHTELGKLMHIQIWNPEVYAFDTIPDKMNPKETAVIVVIAILSSVMGAVIPATRAARLNPVESLRWE